MEAWLVTLILAHATLLVLIATLIKLKAAAQVHHGYIGWMLLWCPHPAAQLAGAYLLLEDTLQHIVQLWFPFHRSSLHAMYQKAFGRVHRKLVARFPWLSKL